MVMGEKQEEPLVNNTGVLSLPKEEMFDLEAFFKLYKDPPVDRDLINYMHRKTFVINKQRVTKTKQNCKNWLKEWKHGKQLINYENQKSNKY